uniref:Polycystic kidney disease 1b n=1 Tax=Callorhinchus milii TaxID=7868 RepID=A0A4W3JL02_CALMI
NPVSRFSISALPRGMIVGSSRYLRETNLLLCFAADHFVSCVGDRASAWDPAMIYSSIDPSAHNRRSCHAACRRGGHTRYSLDVRGYCLCGSPRGRTSPSPETARCSSVCSNPVPARACGRSVVRSVYEVRLGLMATGRCVYSLYEPVVLTLAGSGLISRYMWDFGDGSVAWNTSSRSAQYKYGLPGRYWVRVQAFTSFEVLSLSQELVVIMVIDGRVGLQCPGLVEAGGSVDIWLQTWQGTQMSAEWRVTSSNGHEETGEDLVLFPPIFPLTFDPHYYNPWSHFLRSRVNEAWIGLSWTEAEGTYHWVDGSRTDSFQNWASSKELTGDCVLVMLNKGGVWKQMYSLCLCAILNYVFFSLSVSHSLSLSLSQLMLFPGLWFSHSGLLTSIEFVVQALKRSTQVRFQIFRPYCTPSLYLIPPGCESLRTPFASCDTQPLCNTTGGCMSGQQWCHLREGCLPVSSPCSSYAFEGITSNILPIANPPRYKGTQPYYSQVADIPLTLSSELSNDVIGIQHDAGPGCLLGCQSSSKSPWRQSYISLEQQSWVEMSLTGFQPAWLSAKWVDSVVCDVRVLYTEELRSFAVTPLLSTGQTQAGTYTYSVTVANKVSSVTQSCRVEVRSKITGLQIIFPRPLHGRLQVPTNSSTVVVIKILSGSNATASWGVPIRRSGVRFESGCPPDVPRFAPACRRETGDTWFAHAHLTPTDRRLRTLSVAVSNDISSQNLSVLVQAHDAIGGLRIVPPGPRRMLVDASQVRLFSPAVTRGTSVTYTWVIDDLTVFAYTGQTYSVIFKRAATYRLKVRLTAVNPVSNQTVETDLIADTMYPMVDAEFVGVSNVIPVNMSRTFTFSIRVDILKKNTCGVIFPWASVVCVCVFVRLCVCACVCVCVCACQPHGTLTGTGNLKIFSSALGDYNLEVETRNRWAFTKKCLSVYARSPLSDLKCVQTPEFPYIDGNVDFEAFPHPSPFGITYTWDFNDQSPHPVTVGRNSTVQHRFQRSGVYNVTLWANNTISAISTHVLVSVVERISGLAVSTNGPNELGVATLVKGKVSQGTNIVWSFDMGDGYIFRNLPKSNVSYIYAAEGNYKVTVSSSNMVNSVNRSVDVNVYALRIMEVMPSGCLVSGQNSFFKARISGSQNNIKFSWNFGDGGPTVGIQGNSSIVHAYSLAGNYTIRINVSSPFNTAYSQAGVCIESLIDSVQLVASNKSVRLNELVQFIAEVVPSEDNQHQYTYLWDFGIGESPILGNGAVSSLYKEVGVYLATVCVSNRIDSKSESCSVVVQESVGKFSVSHDGSNQTTLSLNKTYRFKLDVVSGTNVTFTWDFGDDTSARLGQNPSHAYSNSGVFTVSAIGTNLVSRMESYLNVMVLTPITELKINTNRLIVEIGKEVTFTATLSGGDQVCFFWAVCRGCIRQEGTSLFKHRFQGLGIYDVLLTARNYVSEERDMISLQAQEKMLDLEIYSEDLVQDSYCATKEDCKLLARVASGSNMTYGWLISQGPATRLRGRGSSMVFHPEAAGDYLAIVLAENGLGAVNQSKRIFVQERISGVKVTGTAESVAIGIPVNLSVSVISGTDLLYQWFLGTDENILTTSISSISYIYLSLGTVVVNVTVSNVLGSADGSMALRVQEAVSRVSYTLLRAVPPFYVPSNATARYQGHAGRGSDITWQWSLPEDMGSEVLNGSEITYTFKRASVYPLTLNASNEVSWESVSHNITVQDCVRGLMIRADKAVARVGDPVIFTISVQRGTSVWYSLYFPTFNVSVFLQGDTYEMVFPAVGENTVTATAWNNVSSEVKFTRIVVVEEITGLHWVSCCPAAVEVNKERTFTAEVRAGLEVIYRWDFQLPGSTDYHLSGQSVSYTPHREGALTVHVKASNAYSTLSLMEVIRVQFPVAEAELWSNGTDLYVNQTVMFRVTIAGGSDVYYRWSFGNSQNVYVNQNSTALYHYTTPDDYAVEVTAYNNISFFVTRLGVTVRKPECVMPEVQLVEPPHTIFRARVNYFEASVDLKGCTLYKTHYLWEAFRASSCEEAQAVDRVFLGNVDTSKPLLVLPKLLLNTSTYCLQFTVSLHRTPLLRSVSFRIRVLQSKLVPVIGGGSRRAWAASQDLLLAGSKSYDPDTKTSEEALLMYRWTCESEILSSPPCLSPASQTKHLITSDVIFQVLIQAERVPCVLLECISCNALSSYRVSRSIHVTLAGQCENCNGFPLTLDNQTTSTGDSNPDLVIRQGVLRNGVNYTFTLSVMDPEKHSSGFSSIMLTPNYPPSGGVCTVKPDTVFYLLETLIYSLIAMSCLDRSDACHQYHLYRGIRSSFSALVPAGTQGNTSAVSIVVEVEDLLGAKTTAVNRGAEWPICMSHHACLTPRNISGLALGFQNNGVSEQDVYERISIRSNVTLALTSLHLTTVEDVTQLSAAMAQCAVCNQLLGRMIDIIGNQTGQGTATPTAAGTNILRLLGTWRTHSLPRLLIAHTLTSDISFLLCAGGALAAVDGSQEDVEPPAGGGITSASVFQLTNQLMKSLMRSRVLNEEPLSLSASGIEVHGKRTNPLNLLCARFGRGCPFHVPDALSGQLSGHREVVQVLMNIGVNPFLAGSIGHYSVSTRVASMEFTTPGGTRIPINDLPGDQSIQVILANNSARRPGHSSTAMSIVAGGWVNFTVRPVNSNRAAGLHIQLTLTALDSGGDRDPSPFVHICVSSFEEPLLNTTKEISQPNSGRHASDEHTVFLSPKLYDTTAPYNINVSSRFSSVPVNVSVTVYTSLCQYFDLEQLRWRTNGMVSTHRTTPGEAVCLTRHLTVFGASMFVSPDAVEFLPPVHRPAQNLIVVITCALVFAVYVVMALIAHKLDHIDINSVGIVPVCGQHGRYKYGIMVKTGWCKNSGTTAHVGISLYGLNKSGSRHLGKEGAFQRNSLDVFQIETDTILGEIWKIRIWHDNTGLDPSWHLEHVIVWDKQTDSMYFFLVRDWLSVENEKNEGMVEKEVLAACEYPTLRSFSRIFLSQLKRGMSEKHIWLSVWDRLPRSRFTRVQRVTCCTLLLYLFLAAVTAWYGAVGVKSKRSETLTELSVVRRAAGTDAVMSANKCLPFGTGVSKSPKKWLFPHWVLYVTYLVCFLLIAASVGVTVTYGRLFHNNVVLMWLISAFSSFLTLFFVLEPIKVLCEALLLALVTKPVDPDEDDNLVEEPLIKKMSEKISKVRPPYGYGLLQAKEEARKVRALHTIMKVREILTKAQHRRSFTQYNHNVDLHVVLTLLLEFPAVGSVASTVDIKPITMMRSSQGANLQLVMMVSASCVGALTKLWLILFYLQIVRQLRFVRRWCTFGKAIEHALQELVAAVLMFFLLMFSPGLEDFKTFRRSLLSLIALLRGLVTLQRAVQQYPASGSIYFISYLACLLWIMARLFSAIIIHSYKVVRVEMYRPAIEPQDYEMIEFFIKRFKLWIGLSKAKEFRHKVKFDGMESLPSRSSRNSKLSRFPSVSADSHYSDSSISSGSMRSVDLNIPESPAGVAYDVQLYLDRLLPTVNSLLGQFDRVNKVTYDLYQIEAGLESVQCKINTRKQSQVSREMVNVQKRMNHPATMQLVLPRTYSTFSESAVSGLRPSKGQDCENPAEKSEPTQQSSVGPSRASGRRAWQSGPPLSADLSQRHSPASNPAAKPRPKSEDGKDRATNMHQAPIKRRAWQMESAGGAHH